MSALILGIPASELLMLAAAIFAGGILTGLLAGLFGVGGGAVIVPVLYEVFRVFGVAEDVRMQLCVGTSLAIIGPTAIRSFLAHREKIAVSTDVMKAWAIPIVFGVILGGLIASIAPGGVFKAALVIIFVLIGAKMLFRDTWQFGSELPGRIGMSIWGMLIGLYSMLVGVSGGALSNLVLTAYGKPMHNAVGISAGVGIFVALPGAIAFALAGLKHQALMPPFSIGYVSFLALLVFAPVSVMAAPYGARLAHRVPKRKLEIAFAVFILLVAARFAVSLAV